MAMRFPYSRIILLIAEFLSTALVLISVMVIAGFAPFWLLDS